jgi:hypothetical protein
VYVCYNLILKMGLTDEMERPCFKLSILVSNGHFNALGWGGGGGEKNFIAAFYKKLKFV